MNALVQVLGRLAEPAIAACRWIVMIVFAIMGMAMFTQIVLRGMGTTILAMEDVAMFGFFWLVFAGAAVAFHERRHVTVDFLMLMVPERGRRVCHVIAETLVIVFMVLFTISGVYLVINNFSQHGMQLRISMAWVYIILPLASTAGILAVITQLARTMQDWRKERNEQ